MKVSDEDSSYQVFDNEDEANDAAKKVQSEYIATFKMNGIKYWSPI